MKLRETDMPQENTLQIFHPMLVPMQPIMNGLVI